MYEWQNRGIVRDPYPHAFFLPLSVFAICGQEGLGKTFEAINDNIFLFDYGVICYCYR